MAFKSLADVLKYYQIHYIDDEFEIIKTANINEAVKQDILFTLREIAY